MEIVTRANGLKIVHLTGMEFETMRLLICIGNTYIRTDRDTDTETKTIAEHIEQEILRNSDPKIEGG